MATGETGAPDTYHSPAPASASGQRSRPRAPVVGVHPVGRSPDDQQVGSLRGTPHRGRADLAEAVHVAPPVRFELHVSLHRQVRHFPERPIEEPGVPVARGGEHHDAGGGRELDRHQPGIVPRLGVGRARQFHAEQVETGRDAARARHEPHRYRGAGRHADSRAREYAGAQRHRDDRGVRRVGAVEPHLRRHLEAVARRWPSRARSPASAPGRARPSAAGRPCPSTRAGPPGGRPRRRVRRR